MSISPLDKTFSALAHPVRRAILARLAASDATVNELAEPFEMSLPAISKHIKVLEGAGLIRRGREAQFRPCQLNVQPLAEIADWAQHYRQIWDARFTQMDAIISTLDTIEAENGQ